MDIVEKLHWTIVRGVPTNNMLLMEAASEIERLRKYRGLYVLIADDRFAMTFHSMDQYRSALMKVLTRSVTYKYTVTEKEMNMKLEPHQRRVVAEKAELDKKAHALSDFIGNSDIFPTLDAAEQERLKEQNDVMWRYSEILGARIAAF